MYDMTRIDRIINELIGSSLDILNIAKKYKKDDLNILKKEIIKI